MSPISLIETLAMPVRGICFFEAMASCLVSTIFNTFGFEFAFSCQLCCVFSQDSCERTTAAQRKLLGNFFSRMLHFAFTGKFDLGDGKIVMSYSKMKAHAMADLYTSILKHVLPSFTAIGSDDSMVEKLQRFLSDVHPKDSSTAASSSSSKPSTGVGTKNDVKPLVAAPSGYNHLQCLHASLH